MAKKRNTIEDYLNELYRRGMAGDEEAQLEYIQFYVMETDMPLPDEAKVWLVTLAEKGDALARRCYFAWAMSGNEGNFDWLKMEQWALALADGAPRDAYCMLGMLYEPGLPGFDDDKVAEAHYRKSLECGNEGCAFYLARVLLGREEDETPYAEVRELLERAERVNPSAPVYDLLGTVCQELGDDAAAVKCFQKLHRLEPADAECCMELARHYATGAGVSRIDHEIALRYFQKAANLGDAEGTFMVGLSYYDGVGTRRNYKRAVDYFQRALEMGEMRVLPQLGSCYYYGEGVRADLQKAEELWQRGVELKDAFCCALLAVRYLENEDKGPDVERVKEYQRLAREYVEEGDSHVEGCIATTQQMLDSLLSPAE